GLFRRYSARIEGRLAERQLAELHPRLRGNDRRAEREREVHGHQPRLDQRQPVGDHPAGGLRRAGELLQLVASVPPDPSTEAERSGKALLVQCGREVSMAAYTSTVLWERRDAPFLEQRYSRAHRWRFDGGLDVPASASAAHVPAGTADPAGVDPEEAFVAALSSCHMLFFLSLAS